MNDIFNSGAGKYIISAGILAGLGIFFLVGLANHLFWSDKSSGGITLKPLDYDAGNTERVYASKNGKRYYPWWCGAGSRIVKKNIIWYATPRAAEHAGYTIAKACQ